MTIYNANITLNGATYSYPAGPFLPNYFVYRTAQGGYYFHLGDALAQLSEVANLGAHHVKVVENGVTIFDGDLDHHPWNGEWSLRRPTTTKKTPTQLFAGNFVPPFGNTGNVVGGVANYQFKSPFDNAGVTKYMPTTGERPDIGMVTDPEALFLLGGDAGPMVAWALAAGSCPNHFRDKTTGLPINLTQYPQANSYDSPNYQGTPYINKGIIDTSVDPKNTYEGYADGWGPQKAHYPDLSYIHAVAYEDPISLKDLQETANFMLCSSVEAWTPQGPVMTGEYRAIAHGLGMLFKAHCATQDAERNGWFDPTIHLPSSYFKQLLDVSLKYHSDAIKASAMATRFSILAWGLDDTLGPWQHEYLMMDLALGVLTGHAEWLPLFLQMLGNVIARTSGKTGWPPAFAAYYVRLKDPSGALYADVGATFDGNYKTGDTGLTLAQYNALKADPMNGGVILGTPEYFMTTRAVLVFADYLEKKGLAPVRATYPDFDIALANAEQLFRRMGVVNPRVSVVSDPNAVPVILPPLPAPTPEPVPIPVPVPTQPPQGVSMAVTSFSFAVGATKQLNLDDLSAHPAIVGGIPSYQTDQPTFVSLTPNPAGVLVTALKPGFGKITVSVKGAGDAILTAESDFTVTIPFSTAIQLDPVG